MIGKKEIKYEILKCLDEGMTNRQEILTRVSDKFRITMIVVKQCSKEVKYDLKKKAEVLGWIRE